MVPLIDSLRHALRVVLPFEWAEADFMLNALLVVILLAPLCAAFGVKVVNYRMAFFSDAISHSAFTGVVIGFVLVRLLWTRPADIDWWDRILPPITLVAFGMLVAAGITMLKGRTELSTDTVIGVFFATVIAGGIALLSRNNLAGKFEPYLYGSILTANDVDVAISASLALIGFGLLAIGFNRLMLIGLNDALAASRGIRTRLFEYVFSGVLALVVTLTIRTVGLLLVTAMLVVPAAAARNVSRSAGSMFRRAVLIGLCTGVFGLVSSYYLDTAAGATIVLLSAAAFVLSLTLRAARGAWA